MSRKYEIVREQQVNQTNLGNLLTELLNVTLDRKQLQLLLFDSMHQFQ